MSNTKSSDRSPGGKTVLSSSNPDAAPPHLLKKALSIRLPDGRVVDNISRNAFVLAFGKSAVPMARGLLTRIGEHIVQGYTATPRGLVERLKLAGKQHLLLDNIRSAKENHINDGLQYAWKLKAHELPDDGSPIDEKEATKFAQQAKNLALMLDERHVLFALISGGGNRFLSLPWQGFITCEQKRIIEDKLLERGAKVMEVNYVRSQMSEIKVGDIAKYAHPARVVTLIISHIPHGDNVEALAGGSSTPHSAMHVLNKYDVLEYVPKPVLNSLKDEIARAQASRELRDELSTFERGTFSSVPYYSPSSNDVDMNFGSIAATKHSRGSHNHGNDHQNLRDDNVDLKNYVIGGNGLAINGAEQAAARLGYTTQVLSETLVNTSLILAQYFSTLIHYICELFEMQRTRNTIHNRLSDLEFELIAKYGCKKDDMRFMARKVARAFNAQQGFCLCAGGEVLAGSSGTLAGGANQEVALACAVELDALRTRCDEILRHYDVVLLAADTDGIDGNSEFAGAIAYTDLVQDAWHAGYDARAFLEARNSNAFYTQFTQTQRELVLRTGPTGTDVMNVFLLIVKPRSFGSLIHGPSLILKPPGGAVPV